MYLCGQFHMRLPILESESIVISLLSLIVKSFIE